MKEYRIQIRPAQLNEIIQQAGYNYRENNNVDTDTWVTFERAYALDKALEIFHKWCADTPSSDKRILLVTEDIVCEYTGQE